MRKKELLEIPVWRRKSDPVKKTYVIEANVLIHKSRKYLVLDFSTRKTKNQVKGYFLTQKSIISHGILIQKSGEPERYMMWLVGKKP